MARKYKLKGGVYIYADPTHTGPEKKRITVKAGQTVVTDKDLIALEGPDRWTLIGDAPVAVQSAPGTTPATAEPQDTRTLDEKWGPLDQMSTKDLKEVADAEGIDLGRASSKAEILRAIREAEAA